MRPLLVILITILLPVAPAHGQPAQQTLTARQIIDKADRNMRGESSFSMMTMTVKRPTWERTIGFKSWTKGNDLSLALVTEPAREKGQTFLKRENNMWNYIPSIGRLIKLPPSMMSQGWMGSDYTNDDILKESSLVNDYKQELIGNETIDNQPCYKISLLPLEDSDVVWGKVIAWVTTGDFLFVRMEYYDEDLSLVRTETGTEIRTMGGRKIPSRMEIIPADNPQNRTIVNIQSIEFNVKLDDSFFSQQNMKTVK
jgi:outer membrane lipoprotein-sorting protein